MGHSVRKVPANWEHPKDENGCYIPLFDGFNAELEGWREGLRRWNDGLVEDFGGLTRMPSDNASDRAWKPKPADVTGSYSEWVGKDEPNPQSYTLDWPVVERTHFQVYQNITEGSPVSPVFESLNEIAQWLVDNPGKFYDGDEATVEEWLYTLETNDQESSIEIELDGLISIGS